MGLWVSGCVCGVRYNFVDGGESVLMLEDGGWVRTAISGFQAG